MRKGKRRKETKKAKKGKGRETRPPIDISGYATVTRHAAVVIIITSADERGLVAAAAFWRIFTNFFKRLDMAKERSR